MFAPRFGFTSPGFRPPFSGPPSGAFYGSGPDGPMFPMRSPIPFGPPGPPVPPFAFPGRMPMPPRPVRFVPPSPAPFQFDGQGSMPRHPMSAPPLRPPPPPPMLRLGKRLSAAPILKRPPNKSPRIPSSPALNINLNDGQYPLNFVQIVRDLMCAQCSGATFPSQRIAVAHYNSQRHQESLVKLGLPKGEIWPPGTGPKVSFFRLISLAS
jgi:hypothetical protein